MTAHLKDYAVNLYGCRFCPMCKPKGEVSLFTNKEAHTTRGRAMILWRIVEGFADWDERSVNLVYEAGLDSSSGAWCVSDYPVHDYILAARAEIVAKGLAPTPVKAIDQQLRSQDMNVVTPGATTLVYSDDASAASTWLTLLGDSARALPPARIGLAFVLGLRETAQHLAQHLVNAVQQSGATELLADGPSAYWVLSSVLPQLDVALPDGVTVTFGTMWLAEQIIPHSPQEVVYHDSSYYRLAALDYELPRQVLSKSGATILEFPVNRRLSDDVGIEGGLHHLDPALAAGVAHMRLDNMPSCHTLVTDCPDSAAWLKEHVAAEIDVLTLPDWVQRQQT